MKPPSDSRNTLSYPSSCRTGTKLSVWMMHCPEGRTAACWSFCVSLLSEMPWSRRSSPKFPATASGDLRLLLAWWPWADAWDISISRLFLFSKYMVGGKLEERVKELTSWNSAVNPGILATWGLNQKVKLETVKPKQRAHRHYKASVELTGITESGDTFQWVHHCEEPRQEIMWSNVGMKTWILAWSIDKLHLSLLVRH